MTNRSESPPSRPSSLSTGSSRAADNERLAARFAAGDDLAVDEVIQRYEEQVTRLVRRLLAWNDDIEDVVQEVFLSALAARSRFRQQSRLSTWLTTIAVNKCRSHHRRRLLFLGWLNRKQVNPSEDNTELPDNQLLLQERAERVRQAVDRLSIRYREVVVLRYLEEMSIDDVAQIVGISRGAVDVRLNRARNQLKELFTDLDIFPAD